MVKQSGRQVLGFVLLVAGLALASCSSTPEKSNSTADLAGRWRHVVRDGVTWRLELSQNLQFTREFTNAQIPADNQAIKGTWALGESDPPKKSLMERLGLSAPAETSQLSTIVFDYWAPKSAPLPVGATVTDYRGGPSMKDPTEPEEVHVRETYQGKTTRDGESRSLVLANFGTASNGVPGTTARNETLPLSRQLPQRFELEK